MTRNPESESAYKNGGVGTDHAAKKWVDKHFPSWTGTNRAILILAFGSGMDAGLAEAQELVRQEMSKEVVNERP